jgi:hypothetical protein
MPQFQRSQRAYAANFFTANEIFFLPFAALKRCSNGAPRSSARARN